MWVSGICGGRYKKKCLFSSKFLEVCLLRCDVGENIGLHKDPATKGKQYKIQINLHSAKKGGQFVCDKYVLNLPLIKIYRADEATHGVLRVEVGKRIDVIIGISL